MIVPAIAVVPLESTVACVPPESVAVLFPVAVTSLPFMLYEVSAEVLTFWAAWMMSAPAVSEILAAALDVILPSLSNSMEVSPRTT